MLARYGNGSLSLMLHYLVHVTLTMLKLTLPIFEMHYVPRHAVLASHKNEILALALCTYACNTLATEALGLPI